MCISSSVLIYIGIQSIRLHLYFKKPFNFSVFTIASLFTVIGTAFALNMLFNIPVWCGVLLTGLSTLVLLALQQYGVSKHSATSVVLML